MNVDKILVAAKEISGAQGRLKELQILRQVMVQDLATVDADIALQQQVVNAATVSLTDVIKLEAADVILV